jgi:predicted pyridoxine 5'-phosphate oxidase superfamily flavin-nucleotide-binding protein
MKNMIATQQCFIGTVDPDGTANVAPKRSARVLSDTSLIFTEGTGGATFANIKNGSRVTICVVNRDQLEGYRFIGHATIHESGELYDKAAATSLRTGLPKPYAVVVIVIEEIHSLKPGPTAGKKIE